MPEGIHRHPVVFVAYAQGVYAIKELPIRFARHEFETLGAMQEITRHVATPVGSLLASVNGIAQGLQNTG